MLSSAFCNPTRHSIVGCKTFLKLWWRTFFLNVTFNSWPSVRNFCEILYHKAYIMRFFPLVTNATGKNPMAQRSISLIWMSVAVWEWGWTFGYPQITVAQNIYAPSKLQLGRVYERVVLPMTVESSARLKGQSIYHPGAFTERFLRVIFFSFNM